MRKGLQMRRLGWLCLSGLLLVGCDARRKIQVYDFNQREVIAVLDHVSSESRWRELPELIPDFERQTFVTWQRMADQRTLLRQYTFRGEALGQWEAPEELRNADAFSVRGEHLVYAETFEEDTGAYKKRLMMRPLSNLQAPGVPLSPNPQSQSLALTDEPPFLFLSEDTLLCLMRPEDDSAPLQLWKVSLSGEQTRLPYTVDCPAGIDSLSSAPSGDVHAVQTSRNEVLFIDRDAKVLARLSVDFPIYAAWWDDHRRFWVYDTLGGPYLCYDVSEARVVARGSRQREEETYISAFFGENYVVVRKRLFMGFYRTTIQDLSGNTLATLPGVTARADYWGKGLLLIHEQ